MFNNKFGLKLILALTALLKVIIQLHLTQNITE
jgi:hypothetical protein